MYKIQVFKPTMEEFMHFGRYINYMEAHGAHLAGVAKVSTAERVRSSKTLKKQFGILLAILNFFFPILLLRVDHCTKRLVSMGKRVRM